LFDLANALLVSCNRSFEEDGQVAPALQYVYGPGRPYVVCDQLVVSWVQIAPGVPAGATLTTGMGMQAFGRVMPRTAVLQVWCFRCLTDAIGVEALQMADPPNVGQVTYDATQIMTDAYVLTRGIARAHLQDTFKTFADGLAIRTCEPVEAAGQIGGCLLTIEAELS
jgi:hypothetical protein